MTCYCNFCLSFYLTCLLELLYISAIFWHVNWNFNLLFYLEFCLTFFLASYPLGHIYSDILSSNLSDTCCDILSDMLFEIPICRSIWHVFWKFLSAVLSDMFFEISICHSISHVLFWNFCLLLYLTCCLKFLSASLSDMLFLPLLYLTCNFDFHLQLYVACFASNFLSAILPERFIGISIRHFT